MFLLILFFLLAIGVSFLCSILEACLLSITPTYVSQMQTSRPAFGKRLAGLKNAIDRPLAAILSLNTIAHTVGAAGVGAQATYVFGEAYFGIISAILTLLILVLSEIIPKTLGAVYWRQLSVFCVLACRWTIILMYPLVLLSEQLTRLLQGSHSQVRMSRDELIALARVGRQEGVVDESEVSIIHNLVRAEKIRVESFMTPRTVVAAMPEQTTCAELLDTALVQRFSRIPIYKESPDDIHGYVLRQECLEQVARDEHDVPLSQLRRPIRILSPEASLSDLFSDLIRHKEHIALVVDRYGGVSGIVTMEDLIETLLGLEITDETDEDTDMQAVARRRWLERARKIGLKPRDEE